MVHIGTANRSIFKGQCVKFNRRTTGIPHVDRVTNDIYRILELMASTSGGFSTSSNNNFIITDIGGYAIKILNKSGIYLPSGYLVKAFPGSTQNSVTIALEDEPGVCGVVYQGIPNNMFGYATVKGPADVFFNENGAQSGGWFQMSRVSSTANTDHGKAQVRDGRIDALWLLGYIWQDLTGEGLSRCVLTR